MLVYAGVVCLGQSDICLPCLPLLQKRWQSTWSGRVGARALSVAGQASRAIRYLPNNSLIDANECNVVITQRVLHYSGSKESKSRQTCVKQHRDLGAAGVEACEPQF